MVALTTPIQHCPGDSSHSNYAGEKKEKYSDEKEESKTISILK